MGGLEGGCSPEYGSSLKWAPRTQFETRRLNNNRVEEKGSCCCWLHGKETRGGFTYVLLRKGMLGSVRGSGSEGDDTHIWRSSLGVCGESILGRRCER